ncbi:hypothetical protein D9M69_637840 [compost metagenome]
MGALSDSPVTPVAELGATMSGSRGQLRNFGIVHGIQDGMRQENRRHSGSPPASLGNAGIAPGEDFRLDPHDRLRAEGDLPGEGAGSNPPIDLGGAEGGMAAHFTDLDEAAGRDLAGFA